MHPLSGNAQTGDVQVGWDFSCWRFGKNLWRIGSCLHPLAFGDSELVDRWRRYEDGSTLQLCRFGDPVRHDHLLRAIRQIVNDGLVT